MGNTVLEIQHGARTQLENTYQLTRRGLKKAPRQQSTAH